MSLNRDQAQFQQDFKVPADQMERLARYADLLRDWQKAKNLVSQTTLQSLWHRHISDSYQLLAFGREEAHWLDIGSGAGLPGIIVALAILKPVESPNRARSVTLLEANGRKCMFLKAVSRETQIPANIINARIEQFSLEKLPETPDYITARALAPLPKLCGLISRFMGSETVALIHKGQDFASEIEEATKYWDFDVLQHPSRIEDGSVILAISNLKSRLKPN
ncbi:MAG: 16S rRNA (guanine(527)-N(7))-methyltransferase RsmG [Hyphomicrobiales bacterium]